MEETVFFNLGNALASKRDQKELIKEAQIAKDTRKIPGKLIIVEDEENGTYIFFTQTIQKEYQNQIND